MRLKSLKLELEDIFDEFLATIEGGTGTSFNILSVPQKESIQPNIIIRPLQDYLFKGFDWITGSVLTGGSFAESSTRVRTPKIFFERGTHIRLSNSIDYNCAEHVWDSDTGEYIGQTGWIINEHILTERIDAVCIVAKSNDSNITNEIDDVGNKLLVSGNKSLIKTTEIQDELKANYSSTGACVLEWVLGSVLTGGELAQSVNRIRKDKQLFKTGTMIDLLDKENYMYSYHRFNAVTGEYESLSGWIVFCKIKV